MSLLSYIRNKSCRKPLNLLAGMAGMVLCCLACTTFVDHKGKTPLVEVEGHFLYREDLQAVLPVGLSADDSLLFVERYLQNWVEEQLFYAKALENIPDNEVLEQRVAAYRKTLIMNAYQQALIGEKLSGDITETEIEAYYRQHADLFKVDRPLIKGLFIKVPLGAPRLADVRRWYRSDDHEAVEHLEKYSLRNAVKYEYFYDKWRTLSEVLGWMPATIDAERDWRKDWHVEVQDSAFCYFLHVTDYRDIGQEEPYEMARSQAKDMLLNIRQTDYIRQVREGLYRRAQEKNEIKYY